MSDAPTIRNRETMARQRRVGRLLLLLEVRLTAEHTLATDEPALSPVELLRSKWEWRHAGGDALDRWSKLCTGDPIFQKRPPSGLTCQLAEDALDGQLHVLLMLDERAAMAADT